jgi:hypothetical protein
MRVLRNFGAFTLFLVLYFICSAVIVVMANYMLDNPLLGRLMDYLCGGNNLYEGLLDLVTASIAGFLGVPCCDPRGSSSRG